MLLLSQVNDMDADSLAMANSKVSIVPKVTVGRWAFKLVKVWVFETKSLHHRVPGLKTVPFPFKLFDDLIH
jgi:hypothetical protein